MDVYVVSFDGRTLMAFECEEDANKLAVRLSTNVTKARVTSVVLCPSTQVEKKTEPLVEKPEPLAIEDKREKSLSSIEEAVSEERPRVLASAVRRDVLRSGKRKAN